MILRSAYNCLLFDGEVTLENGGALKDIYNRDTIYQFSGVELKAIAKTVRKEFPGIVVRSHPTRENRLVELPENRHLAFNGYAYDSHDNYVFMYELKIGPSAFINVRRKLIEGPKRVDRWEFEGRGIEWADIENSMGPYSPTPEVARIKKQEFDEMMRFREIVMDAIDDEKSEHNKSPNTDAGDGAG